MFTQFFQLMALAVFCFGGFLYALWTYVIGTEKVSCDDNSLDGIPSCSRFGKSHYTATQIAWWMADLWFGLDASGFEKAG